MRAVIYDRFGEPPQIREVADPACPAAALMAIDTPQPVPGITVILPGAG